MPSSFSAPGWPRWKVAVLAMPCSLLLRLVDERKIAGWMNGRRILALTTADWRRSRLVKRLDFRSASSKGLS